MGVKYAPDLTRVSATTARGGDLIRYVFHHRALRAEHEWMKPVRSRFDRYRCACSNFHARSNARISIAIFHCVRRPRFFPLLRIRESWLQLNRNLCALTFGNCVVDLKKGRCLRRLKLGEFEVERGKPRPAHKIPPRPQAASVFQFTTGTGQQTKPWLKFTRSIGVSPVILIFMGYLVETVAKKRAERVLYSESVLKKSRYARTICGAPAMSMLQFEQRISGGGPESSPPVNMASPSQWSHLRRRAIMSRAFNQISFSPMRCTLSAASELRLGLFSTFPEGACR